MSAVVLLLEDDAGGVMGVRFPSAKAAHEWEDGHPEVEAVSLIRLVTPAQALREVR